MKLENKIYDVLVDVVIAHDSFNVADHALKKIMALIEENAVLTNKVRLCEERTTI